MIERCIAMEKSRNENQLLNRCIPITEKQVRNYIIVTKLTINIFNVNRQLFIRKEIFVKKPKVITEMYVL